MPAKSKKQFRYIEAKRSEYGSADKAPDADKWVFESDWTHGVDYHKLPEEHDSTKSAAFLKAATGTPGIWRSLGVGAAGVLPGGILGDLAATGIGSASHMPEDSNGARLLHSILRMAGGAVGSAVAREYDNQFDSRYWDAQGHKHDIRPREHHAAPLIRIAENVAGLPVKHAAESDYKTCPECGGRMMPGPKEGYAAGNRYRGSVECWDCGKTMSGSNWKKAADYPEWHGFDFDGTLVKTCEGDFDHTKIGEPVAPMLSKLREHLSQGDTCKIFTARASSPDQLEPVRDWLKEYDLPALEITNVKDPGCQRLYDDKAVSVQQDTGKMKEAADNADAADSPVAALRKAKSHSDAGRMAAKHAILNRLLAQSASDFHVDSPGRPYAGLTHTPSGFRIHAPAHIAAKATGEAPNEKAAQAPWRQAGNLLKVIRRLGLSQTAGSIQEADRTWANIRRGVGTVMRNTPEAGLDFKTPGAAAAEKFLGRLQGEPGVARHGDLAVSAVYKGLSASRNNFVGLLQNARDLLHGGQYAGGYAHASPAFDTAALYTSQRPGASLSLVAAYLKNKLQPATTDFGLERIMAAGRKSLGEVKRLSEGGVYETPITPERNPALGVFVQTAEKRFRETLANPTDWKFISSPEQLNSITHYVRENGKKFTKDYIPEATGGLHNLPERLLLLRERSPEAFGELMRRRAETRLFNPSFWNMRVPDPQSPAAPLPPGVKGWGLKASDWLAKVFPASEGISKSAIVKQDGDKWVLWPKDMKRRLGTHDSAQDAYRQEYAIRKAQGEAPSAKAAGFADCNVWVEGVEKPMRPDLLKAAFDLADLFKDPQRDVDWIKDSSGNMVQNPNADNWHMQLPGGGGAGSEAPAKTGWSGGRGGLAGIASGAGAVVGEDILPAVSPAGAGVFSGNLIGQAAVGMAGPNRDWRWNTWMHDDPQGAKKYTYYPDETNPVAPTAPIDKSEGFWGGMGSGLKRFAMKQWGDMANTGDSVVAPVDPAQRPDTGGYWSSNGPLPSQYERDRNNPNIQDYQNSLKHPALGYKVNPAPTPQPTGYSNNADMMRDAARKRMLPISSYGSPLMNPAGRAAYAPASAPLFKQQSHLEAATLAGLGKLAGWGDDAAKWALSQGGFSRDSFLSPFYAKDFDHVLEPGEKAEGWQAPPSQSFGQAFMHNLPNVPRNWLLGSGQPRGWQGLARQEAQNLGFIPKALMSAADNYLAPALAATAGKVMGQPHSWSELYNTYKPNDPQGPDGADSRFTPAWARAFGNPFDGSSRVTGLGHEALQGFALPYIDQFDRAKKFTQNF